MSKFRLKINLSKFKKNLTQHLKKNMNQVMLIMVEHVKSHFGPSNQGGKNPSEEGSTPNIGIGTLRNSISFQVVIDGRDVVGIYGVRKGPASAYAKRLELGFSGTDSLGRNIIQQPRPYLKPAYQLNKRKIVKLLRS